ncbi:putative Cleavage and polyadenylation specificity factor subunit 3 [Blattamonas nauphoetae]|uniref:Cleavage and polyadenylation specificity factor subunit 3 n=1 Tax=Blattamonas nauphoetae TaxID=2049346 RepID=A0ABQ9Y4F5_9EUKA|nr:putative Cleavage and polyadenylation specificity factor subunit 3 [Blattamonas nauphoetae]
MTETENFEKVDFSVTVLGAGQEVGRSCILLKCCGRRILLDCGIHPAKEGVESYPTWDPVEEDLHKLDMVLISHFHLDHSAALPMFVKRFSSFKGPIIMNPATKDFCHIVLGDYVKVSSGCLYDEADIATALDRVTCVDYHEVIEYKGIKIVGYNAGHVLGATMWSVTVNGCECLYTGDFSLHEDRLLKGAEIPPTSPDILIMESTYGERQHDSRLQRERRFTHTVTKILEGGGRVLIPVFALGRAQEILLILNDYWERNKKMQQHPIYYVSSLASKALPLFRRYANMLNDDFNGTATFGGTLGDPFDVDEKLKTNHYKNQETLSIDGLLSFRHVKMLEESADFQDLKPCVVLGSPGMMQNGFTKELFERWAPGQQNGVVLTGYTVEGTPAHELHKNAGAIMTDSGQQKPLKLRAEFISFSAHSDFAQSTEFLSRMNPRFCVLVHGNETVMGHFQHRLADKFTGLQIVAPPLAKEIVLPIFRPPMATLRGKAVDWFRQTTDQYTVTDAMMKKPAFGTGFGVGGAEVLLFEDGNEEKQMVSIDEVERVSKLKRMTISNEADIPMTQTKGSTTKALYKVTFGHVLHAVTDVFKDRVEVTEVGLSAEVAEKVLLIKIESTPLTQPKQRGRECVELLCALTVTRLEEDATARHLQELKATLPAPLFTQFESSLTLIVGALQMRWENGITTDQMSEVLLTTLTSLLAKHPAPVKQTRFTASKPADDKADELSSDELRIAKEKAALMLFKNRFEAVEMMRDGNGEEDPNILIVTLDSAKDLTAQINIKHNDFTINSENDQSFFSIIQELLASVDSLFQQS